MSSYGVSKKGSPINVGGLFSGAMLSCYHEIMGGIVLTNLLVMFMLALILVGVIGWQRHNKIMLALAGVGVLGCLVLLVFVVFVLIPAM